MEIKRTRILHRRYTASEWTQKTLMQGEIGILLSDKDKNGKQEVLQARIGMKDNSTFNEGLLIGLNGTDVETTKQVPTYYDLPGIGNEQVCYIVKDTNSIYRWDDKDMKYYSCSGGSDWHEIGQVNGGSASDGDTI